MPRVLYISCSSFSGSTLLSLLLNTHPEMATVGHSNGWPLATAEFQCSCGARLNECSFWRYVANAFQENGLPFAYNNFGTRYEVVGSERMNRYLTAKFPFVSNATLEHMRDDLIRRVPGYARRLAQTDRAYHTLVEATLSYNDARVYVDNSHSPYYLRHLRRISDLELSVVHLVRDIRGHVFSRKKNSGWSTAAATQRWLSEQSEIVRILREFDETKMIFSEELCERPNETLNEICDFIGVSRHDFDGSFGVAEHHVLGNDMRLTSKRIQKTASWRDALTQDDLDEVGRGARAFVARHQDSPVSDLARHYLG